MSETVGKKDFLYRIRISSKEGKETRLWLRLVDTRADGSLETMRNQLVQEGTELMNILGAIIRKSE